MINAPNRTAEATPIEADRHPPGWMSWSVWGLGAFLFLIGFYQRVAPAVLTDELMADFKIGATALGQLSGVYFYSYLLMQVPTGLLADAWGPRRLLFSGSIAAGIGIILFAVSPSIFWAGVGRFLVGGSVAVAFVICIKIATNWFSNRLFALVTGLGLATGILGAVGAGVPLRLLVDWLGWRPVIFFSGLITLILAAAIWVFVRDDPSDRGYKSYSPIGPKQIPRPEAKSPSVLAGLKRVMGFRNPWLLFFAPGGMVGPALAFGGLWGVPYLKARFGLEPSQGAAICSSLMVCWAIGGPVFGALSDRLGRRKPVYLAGSLTVALGWPTMIYLPDLPLLVFVVIMALTGLGTGAMIIGFAFGKESVPAPLAGTSAGLINMGVMLGPTILQPAIGWVLDQHWTGRMAGDVRIYDMAAYKTGFGLMLFWAAAAVILVALTSETHCRQNLSPK